MGELLKIVAAAIGNCIHVAGLLNFLKIASKEGFETIFLGPAVPVETLVDRIISEKPDIVAISYRLTPETFRMILKDLKSVLNKRIDKKILSHIKFVFGGTQPVAKIAQESGLFDKVFTGEEGEYDIIAYLRMHQTVTVEREIYPQTVVERIKWKHPYPLIRHHFGLPSLADTINGAKEIADAKVLDILSIGTDQNGQVSFFRPAEMDPKLDGAGGVPVRRKEDLKAIYDATRTGNYPLVRCYAGTRDLIKWAEMSVETINNCWGAIPICWYSELDKRSPRTLYDAIKENQSAIKWYAMHNIPVEVNESHQWALRGSGDTIEVATSYIAAYNAKELGVKHYIIQCMLNTPPGISPLMDIAKMLAKIELVERLHDDKFQSFRMIRTGLAFLSSDSNIAKGQLASSILVGLALKPHIVHVVGYCEGSYAATPKEIIESCKIAEGVIKSAQSTFEITMFEKVQKRKAALIEDAMLLCASLNQIARAGVKKPLIDVETLVESVRRGILDASDLKGSSIAKGAITTKIIDGACMVINPETEKPVKEAERLKSLGIDVKDLDISKFSPW